MELKKEKQENNVTEVKVTIVGNEYLEYEKKALEYLKPSIDLKGFRKGFVPLDMIKKNVSTDKLFNEVFNYLYPDVVKKAIDELKLIPLISPKVKVEKIEDGKFSATFVFVERPDVEIKNYKTLAKEAKKKSEVEVKKHLSESKDHEGHDHTHLQENTFVKNLLESLETQCKVFLSEYLIEEERNLMLERFFAYLKNLNITVENYLTSSKIKYEDLIKSYKEQAEKNLKREFALSEIGKLEKIEVSDKEVMDAINSTPDEKIKKQLETPQQKIYIKNQIYKDKIIKRLKELADK